jgi:hypothetical protein
MTKIATGAHSKKNHSFFHSQLPAFPRPPAQCPLHYVTDMTNVADSTRRERDVNDVMLLYKHACCDQRPPKQEERERER